MNYLEERHLLLKEVFIKLKVPYDKVKSEIFKQKHLKIEDVKKEKDLIKIVFCKEEYYTDILEMIDILQNKFNKIILFNTTNSPAIWGK